ncbi:MAG TPA: hypothetical protein VHD62_08020 [Opitutaceae bacterium]|nr:hypothetical protein [Opitutaceae bacterium]
MRATVSRPARIGARRLRSLALVCAFAGALRLAGATSAPAIFQSGPGQFEVAAADVAAARTVTTAATEAWRLLEEPLGLPAGFSTPVLVRVIPAQEWNDAAPFRVTAEPAGLVSLRVRADERSASDPLRHALVRALLTRLIVSLGGASDRVAVPAWLEDACVGAWRTRADPAQLDAFKFAAARIAVPPLSELLGEAASSLEPPRRTLGAWALMTFLQSESTAAREWPAFLRRVLAGEPAWAALAASFPGRFRDANERELWWETSWHHLRRVRTLPIMDAAESREELAALIRFVFQRSESDVVVDLGETLTHASEAAVRAELTRRASELNRLLPALHPFYRNAGLSLAAVLAAPTSSENPTGIATARANFARDWRDATELEAATASALDRIESRMLPR